MNQFIKQSLLTGLIIYPIASVAAATLSTFTVQPVASFKWHTQGEQAARSKISANSLTQVALSQAPANNFGPPSVITDETGQSLYLLDSANQRILVFDTTNNRWSSIELSSIPPIKNRDGTSTSLSATQADDLCVMDQGRHFYLLFSRDKKVTLYTQTGKVIRTYSIDNNLTPIGIRCHQETGLVFDALDGHFYHQKDGKQLNAVPIGQYDVQVEQHQDSQGIIWFRNHETQMSGEISIESSPTGLLKSINFIGLDKDQNVYISVEEVLVQDEVTSETEPVIRWLRKYSPKGELIAQVELPYSLYAYTTQDLAVTDSGEVYQIVPLPGSFELIKWQTSLQTKNRSASDDALSQKLFSYTNSQSEDFHPSETDDETTAKKYPKQRSARHLIARQQIIRQAHAYTKHKFQVGRSNITSRRGVNDGQKRVITPIRSTGYHRGMPYKWGGNDSIETFNEGLKNGKKAGDRCTAKHRNCRGKYMGSYQAVGVDCSGLISQVWELKKKYSTSTLPTISTRITKKQLQAGDILNKRGHVMLFYRKTRSGRLCVYEASAKDWKVSARCYSRYQLREYSAYRYNGLSSYGIKPEKLYIYGNITISEEQSTSYIAKVRYSDGSYQDVTNKVDWTVINPYDSQPTAYFRSSRLYAHSVSQDEKVYIKASYTDKNISLMAQTPVHIHNTAYRGWWWWWWK